MKSTKNATMVNMSDLRELQKKIVSFRDARDWKQYHNPKDVAISLCLEASELLEHFQWKNLEEVQKYLELKKDEVSDELMDILYWVLLLAHDLSIDIPIAFDRKMKKNEEKYPVEKVKGRHNKYTDYQ